MEGEDDGGTVWDGEAVEDVLERADDANDRLLIVYFLNYKNGDEK